MKKLSNRFMKRSKLLVSATGVAALASAPESGGYGGLWWAMVGSLKLL